MDEQDEIPVVGAAPLHKSETQKLMSHLPADIEESAVIASNPAQLKIMGQIEETRTMLIRQDEATALRHEEYLTRFSDIDAAQAQTNGSVRKLQDQAIRDEESKKSQDEKIVANTDNIGKLYRLIDKMTNGASFRAGMAMAFQKASTWVGLGIAGLFGFLVDHWEGILRFIQHHH